MEEKGLGEANYVLKIGGICQIAFKGRIIEQDMWMKNGRISRRESQTAWERNVERGD